MEHIKQSHYITYAQPMYREYHHTDMSRGLVCHHVARMRLGTARIVTLAGEELLLRAGDVFYLPMGLCYHSYWYGDEADGERRVEWDSVGFTYFPDFSGRHFAPQLLHPDEAGMASLERVFELPFDTVSGSGWLYLFLGRMLPDMIELQLDPKQRALARARQYIAYHPNGSVEDIAGYCGVSQSSLYSLFREHSRQTIRELKNQVRIEQAIELLATTDLSVEEISRRLEFCSAAYFRVIFKQVTGKAPTDVRREKKWI